MQLIESSWKPESFKSDVNTAPAHKDNTLSGSDDQTTDSEGHDYFMAKVSCLTIKCVVLTFNFFSKYVMWRVAY